MKKYTTLALIGAIVAGIAGLISIDAISATSLVSMQGASDFHEAGIMMGHVTYEVRGADGMVKQYLQGDNVITEVGTDCAAEAIFGPALIPVCTGLSTVGFIAIGNATGAVADATDTELDTSPGDNGIEMARQASLTPVIVANTGGAGTIVTLTTTTPFTFEDLGPIPKSTIVTQSALFDAVTGGNMFAIKDLPAPVTVTNPDTLAVTWTITLKSP